MLSFIKSKAKIFIFLTIAVVLIAMFMHANITRATSVNTFSGTIKDQNGGSYNNAILKLTEANGSSASTDTTSTGNFSLSVQPGMYWLSITAKNGSSNGMYFTVAQDSANPSIDLAAGDVTQDLLLPTATVSVSLYNDQGYMREGKVAAITSTNGLYSTPASIPLYTSEGSATTVQIGKTVQNQVFSTVNGVATFKTLAGVTYGTSPDNGICAYTATNTTLIACNSTPVTTSSGTNSLSLPNTPAPRKTFSGTLKDQNGGAYNNATLKLTDSYGNFVSGDTTSAGNFSLSVQPGMYWLSITAKNGSSNGMYFTVAQDATNPSINLTTGDITQDLVLPTATVGVSLYNDQGYMKEGKIAAISSTSGISGTPASISLYSGASPLTNILVGKTVQNQVFSTVNGVANFKTLAGINYGTSPDNGICAYTPTGTTLIACNSTPITTSSGANSLDLPNTPATRNIFSGTLKDQNGGAYYNATLKLTDTYGNFVSGDTTSTGSFSLSVQPGMYWLSITAKNGSSNGLYFTVAQDSASPSINLTTGDITQDLVLPTATVNISLRDAQGNLISGRAGAMTTNMPASISINSGQAPLTTISVGKTVQNIIYSLPNGVGSFKTLAGVTYGIIPDNGICVYTTGSMTLIGCNTSPYLVLNGANSIRLPRPIAPEGLTAASPTSNPILTWLSVPTAQQYYVYRNGIKIGNSLNTSFNDNNVANGVYNYQVSTVENTAEESTLSEGASVTVVQTVPQLDTPILSKTTIIKGQSSTATLKVLGNLYGITGGEYYIGSTDPGQGNGALMSYSNGEFATNLSGLGVGTHTVNFRANNSVGWSAIVTAQIQVVLPTFSGTLKDQNGGAYNNATLKLTDSYGNFVSGDTTSTGSFSLSVQPGMYWLSITAKNGSSNGLYFTVAQDSASPSIDLISDNLIQNLMMPTATVSVSLYNDQGYMREGKIAAIATTNGGNTSASISLYPGGEPLTTVQVGKTVQNQVFSTANGVATFKTLAGVTYGTTPQNGICAYTATNTTLIACNVTSITPNPGVNSLDLPNTPAPRKTFSGTLKDQNGGAYNNATLKLTDSYGNFVSGDTTPTGSFSLSVQPGMYWLSIAAKNGSSNGMYFTVAQDSANPSIDLTNSDITLNLVLPNASVNVSLYNNQGYSLNGKIAAISTTLGTVSTPASISLYTGGAPLTTVQVGKTVQNQVFSTANGVATFKTLAGVTYGTTPQNGICAYTATNTTLIACNAAPISINPGINSLDLPNTPAPRKAFSGTLKDQNGASYNNATLKLTDSYGNFVSGDTTSTGSFSLSVQPGMYWLSIAAKNGSSNGLYFTVAQDSTNPSIDLTSGDITQNMVLPTATVNISLRDAQGNLINGKAGAVINAKPVSISLYAGSLPITTASVGKTVQNIVYSLPDGSGSFKSIVGVTYGTTPEDGICTYTTSNILISCNSTPFTVGSAASVVYFVKP